MHRMAVWFWVVGLGLAVGCASPAGDASLPTITPVGGTSLEPSVVRAYCANWDGQSDPRRALRVEVFSGSVASPQLPYWSLKFAVDEVAVGATVSFPSTSAELFVADLDPPAGTGNEASSNSSASTGTMQLRESSCDQGEWVDVAIDALLDSEVGSVSIAVTGVFLGTITPAPEP